MLLGPSVQSKLKYTSHNEQISIAECINIQLLRMRRLRMERPNYIFVSEHVILYTNLQIFLG
jgi:hypothetical protein